MSEFISETDILALGDLMGRTGAHGVLALTDDHLIAHLNRELAELLGYQQDELIGYDLREILPDAVVDDHVDLVDAFKREGTRQARGMKAGDRMIAALSKSGTDGRRTPIKLHSVVHMVRGHPTVLVWSPARWAEQVVEILGKRT